ncbi:MAG TPA: hypothetical protein DCQ37_23945 [Desulfobacteraceae bacterium]|nr:hypothetical protein [Desulfobacteraceae bacterium]
MEKYPRDSESGKKKRDIRHRKEGMEEFSACPLTGQCPCIFTQFRMELPFRTRFQMITDG